MSVEDEDEVLLMNTQTPDHSPIEKSENEKTQPENPLRQNVIDPLMENARSISGRAASEISQGAELIRAKVIKSAEDLKKATFADHVCNPPKML